MVWDVIVAAAFVVVSVAVLAEFPVSSFLTWLKQPHPLAPQHRLLMSSLYSRLRQRRIKIQIAGHTLKARKKGLHGSEFDRRTI